MRLSSSNALTMHVPQSCRRGSSQARPTPRSTRERRTMADETRGTTPRMNPAAPSSLSSCAATERHVGFGFPGSNGAVCSLVFTTSSGVVSSPEVAPAQTAANVCTGTTSDAAGGGASGPRAEASSDHSTRW